MSAISQRKITVVGAGFVGMTAAQRCAQQNLCAEVVLIDILEGRPQGIALDLNQAAAVDGSIKGFADGRPWDNLERLVLGLCRVSS